MYVLRCLYSNQRAFAVSRERWVIHFFLHGDLYNDMKYIPNAVWIHRSCMTSTTSCGKCFHNYLGNNNFQMWAPQFEGGMGILKRVEWRVTKMMKRLEHPFCEERLREVGLFSLKQRRLEGILSMCINTWRKGTKRTEPGSFQRWQVIEAVGRNWNRKFLMSIRSQFFSTLALY